MSNNIRLNVLLPPSANPLLSEVPSKKLIGECTFFSSSDFEKDGYVLWYIDLCFLHTQHNTNITPKIISNKSFLILNI